MLHGLSYFTLPGLLPSISYWGTFIHSFKISIFQWKNCCCFFKL